MIIAAEGSCNLLHRSTNTRKNPNVFHKIKKTSYSVDQNKLFRVLVKCDLFLYETLQRV